MYAYLIMHICEFVYLCVHMFECERYVQAGYKREIEKRIIDKEFMVKIFDTILKLVQKHS